MDQNMMYIAGGAAALVVLIIVILVIRKKKKGGESSSDNQNTGKEDAITKYNTREASDEELESAPKLELQNFDDGVNTLTFRFEIKGGTLKLDDVNPYDNDWGFIHNYGEVVGQTRHSGQKMRLFFNRRKRKSKDNVERFRINIIYRDDNGTQWLQPLFYSSSKGIKVKDLMIVDDSSSES